MAFLLTSKSVYAYLSEIGLWPPHAVLKAQEQKAGKNFNLRVQGDSCDLLVKQEVQSLDGKPAYEFSREWAFYQLLKRSPELSSLRKGILYPLHFDADNAIFVFPYLQNACDLDAFYNSFYDEDLAVRREQLFPSAIASAVGKVFARLHSSTFQTDSTKFPERFIQTNRVSIANLLGKLSPVTPEMLCTISSDALKFFRLYQRCPDIESSIEQLSATLSPQCIVHNDPRFANFLLIEANRFEESQQSVNVQLIDWEKWCWGDPADDLGKILANYLEWWISSLPVSANMSLPAALDRATIPLSSVQPSTAALITTYFVNFPKILSDEPDFLVRVVQFIGLALIAQIRLHISQVLPIGNVDMAAMQVAKTLLCQPEAAISTVFGQSRASIESFANVHK